MLKKVVKWVFETKDIKWEEYSDREKETFGTVVGIWLIGLGLFGYGIYDFIAGNSAEMMLVGLIAFTLSCVVWVANIAGVYKRRSVTRR